MKWAKRTAWGLLFAAVAVVVLFKWGGLSGVIRGLETLARPVVHKEIINRYCGVYKEDPYFIISIMKVESNFLHGAKSRRGAVGLMQIMPSTGKEIAKDLQIKNFNTRDLMNPEINVQFGIYYISWLRRELGKNDVAVLAAYNAGMKNVQKWIKTAGRDHLETKHIDFIETKNFVHDVLYTYSWLKHWQGLREKFVTKPEEES